MRTTILYIIGAMIAGLMPAMAFAQQCNDEESFLVRVKAEFLHEDGNTEPVPRLGTGFLVTNDGWVLTAAHVVRESGIWRRSGAIQVALMCSPNQPLSWLAAGEPVIFDDDQDSDFDIAAFRIVRGLPPAAFSTLAMASLDNAGLSDRRFTVRGFGDGSWEPRGASGLSYEQRDANPNILQLNGQFTNGHSGSPLRNEHKQAVGLVYSVSNSGQDRFKALLFRGAVAKWIRDTTGAFVDDDATPVTASAQSLAPNVVSATPASSEFAPGYVFVVDQGVRVRQCGNLFNWDPPGAPIEIGGSITRTFTGNAFNASMSQAPGAVSRLVQQALGDAVARVHSVEAISDTRDFAVPDPAGNVREVNPRCLAKLGRIRQVRDPHTSEFKFSVPVYVVLRSSVSWGIRYTLLDADGAAINVPTASDGTVADGWRIRRLNDRTFEVVREADQTGAPFVYTAYQPYRLHNVEAVGQVSGPPRARLSRAEPTRDEIEQISSLRN